jgi:hypothetical protein
MSTFIQENFDALTRLTQSSNDAVKIKRPTAYPMQWVDVEINRYLLVTIILFRDTVGGFSSTLISHYDM